VHVLYPLYSPRLPTGFSSDTQNQANAIDGYDRSTDALQDREEKAGTDDDDPRAGSRCDNPVGGKIPLLSIDFR
jgi:hypothetical protein